MIAAIPSPFDYQEQLLQLLWDQKSIVPEAIWDALGVRKQGAIKLMQPLLDAGLVQRVGTHKTGVTSWREARIQ